MITMGTSQKVSGISQDFNVSLGWMCVRMLLTCGGRFIGICICVSREGVAVSVTMKRKVVSVSCTRTIMRFMFHEGDKMVT